jgi:hypothetical protein
LIEAFLSFKFGYYFLTKLTKEPIMSVSKLVEIYDAVDEFLKKFMPYIEQQLLPTSSKKPTRTCSLTLSEIMTILIAFHVIGFRNFKTYYIHLQQFHSSEFKKLVSYNRFVELVPRSLISFYFFTQSLSKTKTGCYFMDATAIKVCKVKRAYGHKVLSLLLVKVKRAMAGFFY